MNALTRDALLYSNAQLREENDFLREQIAFLTAALMGDDPLPLEWNLTDSEERLVRVLMARQFASKDTIMAALYWDKDEPVTVGVDLAKGPDVHVEVVVEKTAEQPVTYKAIAEKLRQRKAEKRQTAKPAPLVGPAGILVDVQNGILSGAHGNLRVEKPVAKVLEHMADGGLYPIDILAQKGGYPKKAMVGDMLQAWKHRFEKIGVEVVFLGKELAKLQAAGA
jgi:ribosomal protein L21